MNDSDPTIMTAKDWFGVGVRLIGVLSFYLAVQYLLSFVDAKTGLSSGETFGSRDDEGAIGYLLYTLGYGAFGTFLLRGTDRIMEFTYPSNRDVEVDSTTNGSSAAEGTE